MNTGNFSLGVRVCLSRTIVHAALFAVVPVVAVAPLRAQTTAKSSGMSAHPSADSTQALASLLVVANRDEVAAGKLASSKATRSDVKAFAQKMVTEHGAALAELTGKAGAGGWMVPDSSMGSMVGSSDMSRRNNTKDGSSAGKDSAMRNGMMRMQDGWGADAMSVHSANQADMKKLMSASGAMFDSLYVATQMKGHQTLLDKLNMYTNASSPLAATVTATKATVQQHLTELRKMQSSSKAN